MTGLEKEKPAFRFLALVVTLTTIVDEREKDKGFLGSFQKGYLGAPTTNTMRSTLFFLLCLATELVTAKKSPRTGSSSRSSSAYAASKRKPKLSYTDWETTNEDSLDEEYFLDDDYRTTKSSRKKNQFDNDEYNFQPPKRKARSAEDQATARSEGTFSGAGKGPLYDAYNQLHTLAQVRFLLLTERFYRENPTTHSHCHHNRSTISPLMHRLLSSWVTSHPENRL